MNRKSIYHLLLVVLMTGLWALPVFAQENVHQISGRVVSIVDNQQMEGVYLRVEGITGVFQETDSEGRFSINSPSYDVTLVFIYPGFKELSLFVGTTSELTVKMIPLDTKSNLDDVVLSNGVKRQQRFTTQAVKTLTEAEFTERSYSTLDGYLHGKVAGVNVTTVDGMLASPSSINIRGLSSINVGSQPLFIIDGMEISAFSSMTEWGSESFNTNLYTNPLVSLNVKDIESITILKDAASKAIYGSRGANGVVVVETTKGERGNSKIDFMVNQGFDFKGQKLDVLNAEENRQYLLEMAMSQFKNPALVLDKYGDYLFNNPHSNFYQDYNNSTLWQNKVQNNVAYSGDYHFRITGGDDVAKYTFSVGMLDKKGVLKNTNMNKMNARFNLDYKVYEWLVVGTNLYFTKLTQDRHPMGFSRYNPLLVAHQKTPLTAPYAKEPDGTVTPLYQDYDVFGMSNPLALTRSTANEQNNALMGGKLYASIIFNKHYSATISAGLQSQTKQERLFLPQAGIAPYLDIFNYSELSNMSDLLFDGRLDVNYQNTFDRIHHVDIGVGVNYLNDQMNFSFGSGMNSPGDEYTKLDQASDRVLSTSNDEQWKMIAVYLRGNYILKGRYIADLTLRTDGSSRFGENKRVAFYPALGLAWRLGEEDVLRQSWLDELKVRASVGYTGNDNLGNYTSKLRFTPSNYKYLGGIALKRLANKDLAPERMLEYNLGLDLGVFNQRLNVSLDFYDRTNQNMVMPVIMTLEQGTPFVMMNSAKMNNRGVEAAVSAYLKTGELNWNISVNVAYNKNKVTQLPHGVDRYDQSYDIFSASAVKGQPFGVYYGYQTAGVFATDSQVGGLINGSLYQYDPFQEGDVKFVDRNKDGVIDANDMTYLGKAMLDIVGGFNLQVSWKGITLSGLLDTQWGRELINGMRYKLEAMQDYSNQSVTVKDRWRFSGDVTNMPRISYNDPSGNNRFSDRWIEDGSFVRLRSVTLSYDIPVKLVQKIKLSKVRMFVNADNLLTFTKYNGFDPEFNHLNSDFLSGVDLGNMYIPRSLTFGIRIGL